MLSPKTPSGIQRRQTQHRRQNSTPAAFQAPRVRPLPVDAQHRRQQRSGMSLDLRGLNLESVMSSQGSIPENTYPGAMNPTSVKQEQSTVSFTNNLGQPSQHTMQVAQTHSQPQPGPFDTFAPSPVQTSFPSPRTPPRTLRPQSPQQPPLSPSKPPTEQQLKDLREHIQSVYGSCGQVFINILPTPTATPQKPAHLPSHDTLSAARAPPNFTDMASINLEPSSSAMTFDFENPEADMGYESSSYYTSDALSPSPISSPQQTSEKAFLEGIEEHPSQDMAFSQPPTLYPALSTTMPEQQFPSPRQTFFPDLDIDATLEFTGISPEDVQRYISEQDPSTSKWTCLYPQCGKIFGRKENIRSHVQTHLGDRQFKCNGCGKRFVRQHDLKRHAKIHSGNKPYRCPCSAGFARQDALTRHRQRGMCVGGFADAVRRQAKRGRPKKNRPDLEQRAEKANKTRRMLASAASSVCASSPPSEACSSRPIDDMMQDQSVPRMLSESASFNDPISTSADPFSFESTSSSFANDAKVVNSAFVSSSSFVDDAKVMPSAFISSSTYDDDAKVTNSAFASSSAYAGDVTSMNLLQQLSQNTQTPPMSPADHRPHSAGSVGDAKAPVQSSPLKGSSTPSHSSIQSNPFSTPPTSPVEPPEDLDQLFFSLSDGACSQFDLEMKAMGEYSSDADTSTYDFLDFVV